MVCTYHATKFVFGFLDTVPVIAIHHEDQALCVLEVMPPQWADFVLTSDIPAASQVDINGAVIAHTHSSRMSTTEAAAWL